MKFSALTLLLGAVGVVNVAAAPTSWVVLGSKSGEVVTHIRLGLAVPPAEYLNIAKAEANVNIPTAPVHVKPPRKHHKACRKAKWHQKAVELSNKIRVAFGLPPIEVNKKDFGRHHHHNPHHSHPDNGKISHFHALEIDKYGNIVRPVSTHDHHHHAHHGHGHLHRAPFVTRLTHSLMSLGKWEGRAVAFVIGCGVGVLLRMIFILSVLFIRAVRGPREGKVQLENGEYMIIENEVQDDASPPAYPSSEEKEVIKRLKDAGLL